jgi:hypothetical protein
LIYRPKLYLNTSAVLDAELVVTKQKWIASLPFYL